MQALPDLTASWPPALRARFEVVRPLGRGGLGEVVAARDHLLGRDVALKRLRPDRTPEQGRLAEECALLASLHHPGIVEVLDYGVEDGVVYLVTALLEGQRLDAWLDAGPDEALATAVLSDLLATLAWLHREGVVHGDLKPANVLLLPGDERPWPVLIDFGLAQSAAVAGAGGGTPIYMAPELHRGARPDAATDLYALGASLRTFAEAHPDTHLADVVRRLAAPSRADRFATAEAALTALEPLGVGRAAQRHLATRGRAALWETALSRLGGSASQEGARWVRLSDGEEAAGFVAALKAQLLVAGVPAVVLPPGPDYERWNRLVACLVPSGEGTPPSAPEARRDLLEVWAFSVARRLRSRRDPPVLIVPEPERLGMAGRLALARVLETGAMPRLVLVGGPAEGLGLGPAAEGALERVSLPQPDAEAVQAVLNAHGIEAPPAAIAATLVARAGAGIEALRRQLEAFAEAGVLTWGAGAWTWAREDAEAALSAADDLDALWERLWRRLPETGRAVLTRLHHLGGLAHRRELTDAAGASLRAALERLMAEGWALGSPAQTVALSPGAAARLSDGRLPVEAPSTEARQRFVAWLSRPDAAPSRSRAAARHLSALGRHGEAAERWGAVAKACAARLEVGEAGEAALAAAESWRRDGRWDEALAMASEAARWLELAADGEALEQGLKLAREAATALGTPEARLTALLMEARVAVHLGRVEAALAATDAAQRLDGVQLDARARLDLRLARGTALAQAGRHAAAMTELGGAAYFAEMLEDRHAVGRVTNSLGIAAFHAGAFLDAADAWERAARAKRETGDLRGARIAESNRGLALRELGRLAEALEAAQRALEAAGEMGDRRGQAMGHLGLAQAWLDVGDADRAAEALGGFDALPVASELVRADAEVLRTRLALLRGAADEAVERAERLLARADEAGLPTVAREAWPLAYLARWRAGRPRPVAVDLAEARNRALAGPSEPGADACLAHALARSGAWEDTRALLKQATRGLALGPVPPGRALATELLAGAARLLGDDGLSGLLAAALAATEEDRRRVAQGYAVARGVQGKAEPPAAVQAASPSEVPVSLPAHAPAPPTAVTTSGPVPRVGFGVPAGRWGEPEAWAEALREAAGASGCALVDLQADGGPAVAARAGEVGAEARWLELARTVTPEAPLAAGAKGRLQVFGAAMAMGDGTPPVGVAFLTWRPEAVGSADAMARALEGPLGLAALALDRRRLARALEAAREALAEHLRRHRDEVTALREALEQSRSESAPSGAFEGIVHRSAGMRRVLQTLDKVTATDVTVLLLGDSGVGKELLARAVHGESARRDGPFVVENCGAVPGDLFESVFFGHVKGAFTGATGPNRGLIEAARGGTLFLDEVGELRPDHQVKLLRVLQERRYRPVGGTREVEADFRLVAATNRDLEQMVRDGTFREDLYYRLAVVTVRVPPLRERREDILPIAAKLLGRLAPPGGEPATLSPEVADALVAYDWPGNVRELENELLRATVLSGGRPLRLSHLSPRVARRGERSTPPPRAALAQGASARALWDGEAPLADVLGRVEREVLQQALAACGGRKAAVARRLGLSRPGLDAKIARHGLEEVALKARWAARRGSAPGEDEG